MSQDLQQTNTTQEVIPASQLEQFKSLYYLFKGKRDTEIKLFDDYKQFRYRDIIELNDKVYKKLSLHQLITDTNSVVITLSKKEIKNFGSWQEFLLFDRSTSAQTKCISLEWDFNIILPNQKHAIPQTHTLRVRIGNDLRPNEFFQVIFQGSDEETDFEEVHSQVVCKIDFVNTQICSELKTIVTEWYEGLPNNSEDHKLIKFILRNKVKIQQTIVILFLLAGIALLNFLAHYTIYKISATSLNELLSNFYLISTISFIAIFIFYITGNLYSDRVLRKTIGKFNRNPMFEFTKGDENKLAEITKKNKKLVRKLALDIFIAIIVDVLAFGVGKMIPTILEMIK